MPLRMQLKNVGLPVFYKYVAPPELILNLQIGSKFPAAEFVLFVKDLSKIEEIYHVALEYSPRERDAFLKRVCGDDSELLGEVKSLLAFDESAQNFFEKLPEDVAADFFNTRRKRNLVGKELSHYRILSSLGAGGMGEVYLAEDTRLKRKIALKILPAEFAYDAERESRFEQEAFAVSALNHPNIITIHGIEKSEEFNFIATEFIDGQTLREKISENPFIWQETVEIGIQIAGALESAHSVGIIHRDIKPSNIMIRHDGYVKVLDFGLAKLIGNGESGAGKTGEVRVESQTSKIENPKSKATEISRQSPITDQHSQLTDAGKIMGTLNYMSPEQSLGEKVDTRTDIFSLGVVLYEMLSGIQPFRGDTDEAIYNETINRIPPSLTRLNSDIPIALDRIVSRAMEKSRETRYQTAGELRADLQKLKEDAALSAGYFIAFQRKSSFLKILLPVAALGILILAGIYFTFLRRVSTQFTEAKIPNYAQLTNQSGEELFPSLAPDGKSFLYTSRESGNWDIYLKQPGESAAINLTGASLADDRQGAFSPDGRQIVFRSERDGGGIFVMNVDGENVRRVTGSGFYPSWSPDGKEIVFCEYDFIHPSERPDFPSELWRVKIETGEKRLITKQDAVQPSWSPNGKWIAFWGMRGAQRDVWIISADGGEAVSITDDAATDWNPIWSPDGKYLYFDSDRNGSMNLWRAAIDENSGKVSGNPEPITTPSNYSQFFSFGRQGNFVYAQASTDLNIWRVDFDSARETVDKKAAQITSDSRIKTDPNLSPDNRSMVFASVGSQNEDLYLANSDGSNIRSLTDTSYKERLPVWSPDGQRIAFVSNKFGGVYEGWVMNPDGSNLRKITPSETTPSTIVPVWSPDGKDLLFSATKSFPLIFDPDKNSEDQAPAALPKDEGKVSYMASSWSSDGKKLAGYTSDTDSSKQHITVYDFNTRQYRDLTDIGALAYWLADNRHLIFYNEDKIYLLDAQNGKLKELLSVKPNLIDSIAISKDNRSIYYSMRKKESDIWLASFK